MHLPDIKPLNFFYWTYKYRCSCSMLVEATKKRNCNARHMDLAGKYSHRFCNFAGPLNPYEFWPTTSHAARWIPPSNFLPPNAAPGLNVQKRPEKARTTGTLPPPPPPPTLTGAVWQPSLQLQDALKQLMPMQKELSNLVIKAKDSIVGLKEALPPPPPLPPLVRAATPSSSSAGEGSGGGLLSLLAAAAAGDSVATGAPTRPPPLNRSTTRKFSASPLDEVDFDFVAAESVRTEPSWPVSEVSYWPYPARQEQQQQGLQGVREDDEPKIPNPRPILDPGPYFGPTTPRIDPVSYWPYPARREPELHGERGVGEDENQLKTPNPRSLLDPGPSYFEPTPHRIDQAPELSSTVPTFVSPRMEKMQASLYVPPGYYESRRRMMRHFATSTTEPPTYMMEDDFYRPTLETPVDLDFEDELPLFESNRLDHVEHDYPEYERFRRTFQREGVKGLWNQLDRFQKNRAEIAGAGRDEMKKELRNGLGAKLRERDPIPNLRQEARQVYREDFRGPSELPANLGSLFSLEDEPLQTNKLSERPPTLPLAYDHIDTFQAPVSLPNPASTTTTMRSVFGVRNPFLRSKASARPTPKLRFSNPTTARPTARPTAITTTSPPPPTYTGQRYYDDEGTTEDSYGAPSAPLYYSSTDRYIQTPRTRQSTYWDEFNRVASAKEFHVPFNRN